jgi:sulfoxide reductase heme-binding subunit YedZ
MIRRLGKRWQVLHRLIYPIGALGVLHYYWKVKADTREPLIFAGVLLLLLVLRLPFVRGLRGRRGAPPRGARKPVPLSAAPSASLGAAEPR